MTPVRNARAYCSPASQCAPTRAARAPARGAHRNTSSVAPAASAWYASRAGSSAESGRARRAVRAISCSSARRVGPSAPSIARRASSWRNRTCSLPAVSTPAARHSAKCSVALPASASNSHISSSPGTIETTSSSPRASGDRPAVRANTASRTVAGSVSPPASSTSVTKNGFPSVSSWSSRASTPDEAASSRTPSSDSGASVHRDERPASSPSTSRSWGERSSVSSRKLTRTSDGTVATLRPTSMSTSSVASSAQWTSSRTSTVGRRRRSSSISAAASWCGGGSVSSSRWSSPATSSATSIRGDSGREVSNGSHAPHRTRASC